MKTLIERINYMAPEIINLHYHRNNCDLYSIGVTIYYLYFRKFPINKYPFSNIFIFEIEEDRHLEDLIKKLLKENPNERITWEEYLEHSFFRQYKYMTFITFHTTK